MSVQELVNLVGIKMAAKILGVSVHTIRRWVGLGRLPVVRLGRRILFDPRKLADFIEKNSIPAREEG